MRFPRLRQLVIASDTTDTIDTLKDIFALGEPFPDPGVGEFGLVNGVFAIGDQFLEVVVPVTETAPAARFMARGGPGWRARSSAGRLRGAELTSPDPKRLMARWASVLAMSGGEDGLALDDGTLRFVPGEADRLVAFDLVLPDVPGILERSKAAGLKVDGNSAWVAGVEMRLAGS